MYMIMYIVVEGCSSMNKMRMMKNVCTLNCGNCSTFSMLPRVPKNCVVGVPSKFGVLTIKIMKLIMCVRCF